MQWKGNILTACLADPTDFYGQGSPRFLSTQKPNHLMIKIVPLVILIMAADRALQDDDHYDLIQAITNFFDQRHVQTITVATCWPSGNEIDYLPNKRTNFRTRRVFYYHYYYYTLIEVNEQLLKKLSSMDKSLSFSLTEWQTHDTWYRQGFMVDLSCDKSVNFMHKVCHS